MFAWNPNGIRSLVKNASKSLANFLVTSKPDILFFCETKGNQTAERKLNKELIDIFGPGWTFHHSYCVTPKGRHGVSVAIRNNNVNVHSIDFGFGPGYPIDSEGRVISICCSSRIVPDAVKHQVIGVYVPNASTLLKRLKFKLDWLKSFSDYVSSLEIPSVIVGDINVAPDSRDLCNPNSNQKTPGFTLDERKAFSALLQNCALVDVWRYQNPTDGISSLGHSGVYTFWETRSKSRERNAGWRIDMVLMSSSILNTVIGECMIYSDVIGSDHCPVGIEYRL